MMRNGAAAAAMVVGVLGAAAGSGCGDDSLSETFQKADIAQEPDDLGPASPIQVGQQLWYRLTTTYRRTTAAGEGGLTTGEAQSSGSVCLQINEVRDTATTEYASAGETRVVANVKVGGADGGAELAFSDQASPGASAAEVDALMASLWVKRMTVPSSGHRFAQPTAQVFSTQTGPSAAGTFGDLPFIEVRAQDDTDRGLYWSGWEYRTDMDGAKNVLGNMISSFSNPREIEVTTATPPSDCETHADALSCGQADCTWATPPGRNQSTCLRLYTARFVWRHSLSAPPDLAGPVLHEFEVLYDTDGVLHQATELVVPDNGGSVPSDLTSCAGSCLVGSFANAGGWSGGAPCRFRTQ